MELVVASDFGVEVTSQGSVLVRTQRPRTIEAHNVLNSTLLTRDEDNSSDGSFANGARLEEGLIDKSSSETDVVAMSSAEDSSSWLKVGNGLCRTWGQGSVIGSSGQRGDACFDLCAGHHRCNFYCSDPDGPVNKRCFRYERCTGLTTTDGNRDVSQVQCYRRPSAKDCVVPDSLQNSPHLPATYSSTSPSSPSYEYVELRGPWNKPCREAFGKRSCEGSIVFDFTCSAAASIKFGAEVTAPDDLAQSLFIEVDDKSRQSWGLTKSTNGGWGYGKESPPFSVTAGDHKVRWIGRADGMRIRTAKIFGSSSCTFSSTGGSTTPALEGKLHGMFVQSYDGRPAALYCDGQWLELGSGQPISYGAKCWTYCPWQYSPPKEQLQLTCGPGGVLDPPSFRCNGNPCRQPTGIATSATQKCEEGIIVPHGGQCTTRCAAGRCSKPSTLSCSAGVLDPPTFICRMCDCDPPSGVKNIQGDKPCREDRIGHSEVCTPNCKPGFHASVAQLTCRQGKFTPETFTCDEEGANPSVQETFCRRDCPASGTARQDCLHQCYLQWIPVVLRVALDECNKKCSFDLWRDSQEKGRNNCKKTCRDKEEALYLLPGNHIVYPQWRLDFMDCTEKWDTGCRFMSGEEKKACDATCVAALPEAARTLHRACLTETCPQSLPDVPMTSSEQSRRLGGCRGRCWLEASEQYELQLAVQNLIGNTNETDGGSCSTSGLENVATRVLEVQGKVTKLRDEVLSDINQALTGIMQTQWMSEEATRQSGGSGVKKVRTYTGGSEPYHAGSFSSPALMSQHNHANGFNTVGLGEFSAVINGVSFRTRHNDYSLKMPHPNKMDYHATKDIPRPPVPPSVLNAGSINEQITEMRTYFKAFKDQDTSLRDYRPYFKPALCYLETGWERLDSDALTEPFESDRHHIAATGWKDLVQKSRFYDLTGNKDILENIPWLPTAVFDVEIREGRLVTTLAKWGYRILCHPIDGDVETARLRLVKDSYIRALNENRFKSHNHQFFSRNARFRVDPRLPIGQVRRHPNVDVSMGRSYLDLLMEQIPGKNNYPAQFKDEVGNPKTSRLETLQEGDANRATEGTAINKQHTSGDLNTGYYSRYFYGAVADAMGRNAQRRGYNDPNLWGAMTNHSAIRSISMVNSGPRIKPGEICYVEGTTEPCPTVSQRWTYATPVEIIYLTPLFNWNPHGIETGEKPGGGNGLQDSPYESVGTKAAFYRTPQNFFGSCSSNDLQEAEDSADTDKDAVWAKDRNGTPRQVLASGQQITTRCIPGVGKVRLRYNIMPIHEEGETTYKEVKGLEKLIEEHLVPEIAREGAETHPPAQTQVVTLVLRGGAADHVHEVHISDPDMIEALEAGDSITVQSTLNEGHVHDVKLTSHPQTEDESDHDAAFTLITCSTGGSVKQGYCVDGHNALEMEEVETMSS